MHIYIFINKKEKVYIFIESLVVIRITLTKYFVYNIVCL